MKQSDELYNPYYAIGVDTCGECKSSYCLIRKKDGVIEVLLSKTMECDAEFKREVEILARCFDAAVI